MSETEKSDHSLHRQYGTFQGVANYPPPPPPPPSSESAPAQPSAPPLPYFPYYPHQYAYAYQAVPGYAVVEGRPLRERRLPCCGIGIGWFLFLIGFFFAGLPWYLAAIVLLCSRIDYREKPGYVACSVAAIILTILIIVLATSDPDDWLNVHRFESQNFCKNVKKAFLVCNG